MTNTNDKPTQSTTPQTENATKPTIANGTQDNKPATGTTEENKVKDPTTAGDATKKPLDPNNPQAKQEAPATEKA
jgi:hypothetical protein